MPFSDHFRSSPRSHSRPARRRPDWGIITLMVTVFAAVSAVMIVTGRQHEPSVASSPIPTSTTEPATNPTTTTTAPTTTTTAVVGDDGGDAEIDRWVAQGDELRAMPDDKCQTIDHFEFLGLVDTDLRRSYPDGSFFHYDCVTGYWGWRFQGNPGDAWQAKQIPRDDLPACDEKPLGELCHAMLPTDKIGVPTDRHHPHFENALTLDDVHVGDTVCLRTLTRQVGEPDLEETLTIESVGTSAYVPHDSDQVEAYPGYARKTDDNSGYTFPYRSAEDDGLVPFQNGLWATRYVTAGAC